MCGERALECEFRHGECECEMSSRVANLEREVEQLDRSIPDLGFVLSNLDLQHLEGIDEQQ